MSGVWLLALPARQKIDGFLKAARMILPLSAPFFICFYPVRSRPPAALAVSEGDIGMTALFRAAI
jgi:hypothetical protein